MKKEEIISKLRDLLSKKLEIDTNTEVLDESALLIEYGLGVDSVSTMEFIVALESEFGIEIDEAEIDPSILSTMNSIAVYISGKIED